MLAPGRAPWPNLAAMTRLAPGSPTPDFSLSDATGKMVSLSDYAGQKIVVYFYPAAMTPGCTTEAVDFTAAQDAFSQAGYQIVGVSPDPPEKLARFADKKQLTITLLADPDRSTIKAYGAWGTKTLYGKAIEGVIRSTFVVDVDPHGKGTIELAQYNVRATGHVERLGRELEIPAID